jgi:hypothetical protein
LASANFVEKEKEFLCNRLVEKEKEFLCNRLEIKIEMSKLVYKRKINPDSFDRETVLLGVKETLSS